MKKILREYHLLTDLERMDTEDPVIILTHINCNRLKELHDEFNAVCKNSKCYNSESRYDFIEFLNKEKGINVTQIPISSNILF